jgi:NAD(P)-dependent dehydrogenase (short-subunit alcohol dehydrogenase family)
MNSGTGRVAVVTGAAQRIGAAIARSLAADGWRVAIHLRSKGAEAAELAAEIAAGGGLAECFVADLSDAEAALSLIPDIAAAMGAPSLLVNNASLFEWDDAASFTPAGWDAHFAVNARAPALLAQAFAQGLGDGSGDIVNIVDQRVWRLTPQFFTYTLSKAALWTATQTLAQALAPRIRVNAIGPGPVLASAYQDEASFDRQRAATPLGCGASPDEICAAIRFILATPSMTGQMIALDGGQHLSWRTPDVDGVET